mmetsp:Transcript_24912/g.50680  ORF Transcript_24912/g.50680 Transcript_24912/m.50680 type:complete len:288 (+) Transcript_24912:1147-2010(+)
MVFWSEAGGDFAATAAVAVSPALPTASAAMDFVALAPSSWDWDGSPVDNLRPISRFLSCSSVRGVGSRSKSSPSRSDSVLECRSEDPLKMPSSAASSPCIVFLAPLGPSKPASSSSSSSSNSKSSRSVNPVDSSFSSWPWFCGILAVVFRLAGRGWSGPMPSPSSSSSTISPFCSAVARSKSIIAPKVSLSTSFSTFTEEGTISISSSFFFSLGAVPPGPGTMAELVSFCMRRRKSAPPPAMDKSADAFPAFLPMPPMAPMPPPILIKFPPKIPPMPPVPAPADCFS